MDRQKEIECLDTFVAKVEQKIFELGLKVFRVGDFRDLSAHLQSQNAVINPSFDPREHYIRQGFWLRVENEAGETVACHAERIFETADFVTEFIETGRLWWEKNHPVRAEAWRSEIVFSFNPLSGSVAYAGSMLISPPYRGKGISRYLPMMSRAIAMRDFLTDFHTGIVRQSLAASKIPRENYGFSKIDFLFSGILPGVKGAYENVYLCWMDRAEGLASLRV